MFTVPLKRIVTNWSWAIMSRHLYLNAAPPPYNGPRDRLDKGAFKKTLPVLAARIAPEKTGLFLKAGPLKRCVESTI